MDAMTPGAREAIADSTVCAKWAVKALRAINRKGGFPDMVIGRPVEAPIVEDEGRTLVLPLLWDEKMYACVNETGGATLMLASEY